MTTGRRIWRTLARNGLAAIPTVIAIVTLNFFLLAGESGAATEDAMRMWRTRFGLDLPVLDQFQAYLLNLAQGNLGFSPRYNLPVAQLIGQRLPGTLILMGAALAIAFVIGVALGSLMALNAGRWPDRVLSVLSLLFYSVPGFWIALMLIVLFSVKLGWLPSGGAETIASGYRGWDLFIDRLRHMLLPAASLALFYVAVYARLTRAAFIEVSQQDYVRTARAKGLPPLIVAVRHVLRNAMLPVSTLAGIHFGGILGGAVVIETVYSWPGLGRLAFESVMQRDFSILLGVLVLSSFMVIIANMLVDMAQAWLDPRIET
jgi:peptide/nickel transport system permease protein